MEEKLPSTTGSPLLRKICFEQFGNDEQLYEAVSFTVSPDPSDLAKKETKYYLELANKYEKGANRNPRIAGAYYWNAGRVAMYEGKLDLARECFLKYADLNPKSPFVKNFRFYGKKENAEKAMKVAQEYYEKIGQKT